MKNWLYEIFNSGRFKREESAEEASRRLVNFTLKSASEVFKDEEFRRYFDFFRQRREERDRLFNELGVTGLCLLLFALDDIYLMSRERIHFWREVRQKTSETFKNWLKELSIPQKYVSLWGRLIDKRYEEYQKDQREIRRELERHDREFAQNDDEVAKNAYVRFMAIAIGAIHHLRKSKVNPRDPFFSHLKTWLGILNIQLEKEILRF